MPLGTICRIATLMNSSDRRPVRSSEFLIEATEAVCAAAATAPAARSSTVVDCDRRLSKELCNRQALVRRVLKSYVNGSRPVRYLT